MVMLPKRHLHSVTSQAPHATENHSTWPNLTIWQSDPGCVYRSRKSKDRWSKAVTSWWRDFYWLLIDFLSHFCIFLSHDISDAFFMLIHYFHDAMGGSQLQVILSAAQAIKPVRLRPSLSSKATIHVPNADSPTKADSCSLGRVQLWHELSSVNSQRRSAHSEVPDSFSRIEVRDGAIKRNLTVWHLTKNEKLGTPKYQQWDISDRLETYMNILDILWYERKTCETRFQQLKRLPVVQVRIHRDFHTGDLITFLVRALVYRNGNVEIASVGWSEGEMPIFWLENRGSAIHWIGLIIIIRRFATRSVASRVSSRVFSFGLGLHTTGEDVLVPPSALQRIAPESSVEGAPKSFESPPEVRNQLQTLEPIRRTHLAAHLEIRPESHYHHYLLCLIHLRSHSERVYVIHVVHHLPHPLRSVQRHWQRLLWDPPVR